MTYEEYEKYYQENFPLDMTFEEVSNKIDLIKDKELADEMRSIFCNNLLYVISGGYIKYLDKTFEKNELISIYKHHIQKMKKDALFLESVYHYFCGNNKKSLQILKKAMEPMFTGEDVVINESTIIECFQEPFKQGFDGFWKFVSTEIQKYTKDKSIVEYCELLDKFYTLTSNEEIVDELGMFIQKYPEFISPKELLASTYQDMNMWKNTIACLESVGQPILFFESDFYFMMAWAYGKCKEYKKEEENYRKCLEIYPDAINAMNNLAYCLYRQKKYLEAKEILEKCLEEKRDLVFAANNYVRVLIALGRNTDAKKFIKKKEYKVIKALKDKVEKLDNKNSRLKKEDIIDEPDEEVVSSEGSKSDATVKRQQFSSEKILEDELTARIEDGMPVFGLNLKIYRRHGVYGRQYRIPIGRLDLLCEDAEGNLYVIELKKDKGYDDAYKQTADYLDWFEKNNIAKGKKVFGIICLNSPTKDLIKKVHADKRMKLYEYQISYKEI